MLGPPLLDLSAAGGPSRGRPGDVVAGWWSSVVSGIATVVPDGSVDLLSVPGRVPVLAGPDVVPRPVELPAGATMVAVRLQPGVASEVLGDGIDRAVGRQVPLDQVWSRLEVDRLDDELGAVDHVVGTGRRSWADGTALALARAVDRRVSVDWSVDEEVRDTIAALTAGSDVPATAIGSRQLRRRFTVAVGYGPALYRRIMRLDRFSRLLAVDRERSLAELAVTAGFFDQAHLTRDCRRLLGVTPAELRRAG